MFFFLRHAETDYNAQGRIADRDDIHLNEAGKHKALLLRDKTPITRLGITRAVSSPLSRCIETFNMIRGFKDIPLSLDERLRERNFGAYAGRLKKDVPLDDMQHVIENAEFGVEGFDSISKRAVAAVTYAMSEYPNDRFLIVSHGAIFTGLMLGLLGTKGTMPDQAELYQFSKNPNGIWECKPAFDTETPSPKRIAAPACPAP